MLQWKWQAVGLDCPAKPQSFHGHPNWGLTVLLSDWCVRLWPMQAGVKDRLPRDDPEPLQKRHPAKLHDFTARGDRPEIAFARPVLLALATSVRQA